MPLDLGETVLQLERAAQQMGRYQGDREDRLAALLQAASQVDSDTARSRTQHEQSQGRPFLAAQVETPERKKVPPKKTLTWNPDRTFPTIIPAPKKLLKENGRFVINRETRIVFQDDPVAEETAKQIQTEIR